MRYFAGTTAFVTGGASGLGIGKALLSDILTQGEFRDEIQTLFDEIVNAFPTDQEVPSERAAFERGRRGLCDGLRHLPVID